MRLRQVFFIIFCCGMLASCASIFTGTSQYMYVNTQTPGAKVYVNGKLKGTTPGPVKVPRKIFKTPIVTVEKDSFQSVTLPLNKEFNRAAYLNTILVHCWLIDLATGALVQYTPFDSVSMQPIPPVKKR